MRIASSTGRTKIFPSPTSPVRACFRIVSTTRPLSLSSTTTSTFSFGRTLTVRLEPRYVSTTPFWRPDPFTSPIDREGNPLSSSSVRIGSNASWRMNASIFFMFTSSLGVGVRGHRRGTECGLANGQGPARRTRVLGLRDELLRVSVHAVLGDVEPGVLFVRRHAETDGLLDRPEHDVGDHEHRDECNGDSECLNAQLVEAAAVPEPRIAHAVQLREPRGGEDPAAQGAHDSGEAVRGERSHRVVEVLVDRQHAEDDDDSGDRTDDRCRPELDVT